MLTPITPSYRILHVAFTFIYKRDTIAFSELAKEVHSTGITVEPESCCFPEIEAVSLNNSKDF